MRLERLYKPLERIAAFPALNNRIETSFPYKPAKKSRHQVIFEREVNPLRDLLQRNVIDSLSTSPTEMILPEPLKAVYEANKNSPGRSTLALPDNSRVILQKAENNITTIRKIRKSGRLFFLFPIYKIEEYYVIDNKTDKTWDMMQLWRRLLTAKDPKSRLEIIHLPILPNAGFARTNTGGKLILNPLSEFKKSFGSLDKEELQILDQIIPGHESGHLFGSRDFYSRLGLGSALILSYVADRLISSLIRVMAGFRKPEARDQFYYLKQHFVESERNAHAFALGIIRKVRDLGVDIFRDIPNYKIAGVIDKALESYDKGMLSSIPHPKFSQRNRKLTRQTTSGK